MRSPYARLKAACYTSNVSMSIVGNLSPLLFLTFRTLYGISYSLLGLLVLINFFTQLMIDLVFSFFSHKFNIPLTVRVMPLLAVLGLALYGLAPVMFPSNVYVGLVIGTVIFSAASGLAEVLISPVIAEIPADDPDREMSKLHSIYAWGVVGVVIFATLFLLIFKAESWQYLSFILLLVPLTSSILFLGAKIPQMKTPEKTAGAVRFLKNKTVWLCMLGIFLGGAAECTMAQWASGYLEAAFGIDKVLGDVFGVALFAAALGFGRTLFSKIGKHASRALLLGAIGATACYLIAALSPFAVIGLLGCAFTGFCVSMLWPGSLIIASDRFPDGGVLIFALMAAGGDLGASFGPQLVGIIADAAMANPSLLNFASTLGITGEQLGMKIGILIGALFPMIAIPVYAHFRKNDKLKEKKL
ncbi:MAG: MFS transporter [Ruminococcaceae bacterium]|nr:MFS transporter [Oscillospiraceae bacterium]